MVKEKTLDRIDRRFKERALPEELETYSLINEVLGKAKRNEAFTDKDKKRYHERYKAIDKDTFATMLSRWNAVAIFTLTEVVDNLADRLSQIEKELVKRRTD